MMENNCYNLDILNVTLNAGLTCIVLIGGISQLLLLGNVHLLLPLLLLLLLLVHHDQAVVLGVGEDPDVLIPIVL